MAHEVLTNGFMGPGILRNIEVHGEAVNGHFQVSVKGEVDGHDHVHHVFEGALYLLIEHDRPVPGQVEPHSQKVILRKKDISLLGID